MCVHAITQAISLTGRFAYIDAAFQRYSWLSLLSGVWLCTQREKVSRHAFASSLTCDRETPNDSYVSCRLRKPWRRPRRIPEARVKMQPSSSAAAGLHDLRNVFD